MEPQFIAQSIISANILTQCLIKVHTNVMVKLVRNITLARNLLTTKMKMNRAFGHPCAHIGLTGPGEPPEDGEMIEMTLPSRHRIRNSSPGGLRPSTLPLGHGGSPHYWLSHVDGEEIFLVSFKPPSPGTEPRTLAWKAVVASAPY